MVTLPRTVVPLRLNAVGTVAPPPVSLLTCVAVRLLGSVSTMLAVVIVLGPVLPITIVKLVVPPTAIVLLAGAAYIVSLLAGRHDSLLARRLALHSHRVA